MTDMQIIDKMASENMDVRMCGNDNLVNAQKCAGGGKITIGVPEDTFQIIINQMASGETTHYVALYVINKEQFLKIKNEGK
jgi:hypothetical protein